MTKLTLQQYYDEVIHMLNRQPGDYHIGRAERIIISECHRTGRPITTAVTYVMRTGCNNS